jgi:hypothetical protein
MNRIIKIIISLSGLLPGCFLLRDRDKMRFRTTDFILYNKSFRDTSNRIKYNGVYVRRTDSTLGFKRFFPDGRVVSGGCYDSARLANPNTCYNSETVLSLYGYYTVRNDTVFMELDDNVPISSGIWIDVYLLKKDTLIALYGFDRSLLKDRSLRRIPSPETKGVLRYGGRAHFVPADLSTNLKLEW